MSRQTCDTTGCHNQAASYTDGRFFCQACAPADAAVTK